MAKDFKDFTYAGQKLSDLETHYISVDFSQNPDTIFALSRNIKYNDTNRFRQEPEVSWSGFDDKLSFELHLVKDDHIYQTQEERILSESEVRTLTRWLTSTDSSRYLTFEYEEHQEEQVRCFYGQFINIEPFNLDGLLYGLKLTFECSSAFGYTDIITNTVKSEGDAVSFPLSNQDDRLNEYCYPEIRIHSKATGEVYLCNMSDCVLYEEGSLEQAGSAPFYMEQLIAKITAFGLAHGYAPEFDFMEDGITKQTLCRQSAIQFRYVDSSGLRLKCIACYSASTQKYYILKGGFFYLKVKKNLPVIVNSAKLFIFDETDHMIPFSDMGIQDMDYMYWFRLASGTNRLLLWGEDCTFTFLHREARKAGV